MWGKKDPAQKLRNRVAKLRRKGMIGEAIELQKQLCTVPAPVLDDLRVLADMGREARLARVEVAAGLMLARLERAAPPRWLSLAELADGAGLAAEATDAIFRAADAAAVLGDCALAIQLCERVLGRQGDHQAARRIRSVMLARLEEDEQSVSRSEWRREPTATLLGGHIAPEWPAGELDTGLAADDFAETNTQWPPPGSLSLIMPFQQWQAWPTVLQDRSLLFVGQLSDLPACDGLDESSEALRLEAGELLIGEGARCDLLYRLERGAVRASRAHAGQVDLGSIGAGSFFADGGGLSNLPATAQIEALEDCTVSVVKRRKLRHLIRQNAGGRAALDLLKGIYLEAVLSISPFFGGCTPEELDDLARRWRFTSARAGQPVLELGQSAPLQVIVTGLAEVSAADREEGYLGMLVPGDLIAELEPSPVIVVARRDLYAIAIDRESLVSLPAGAQAALGARAARCRQALQGVTADADR